MGHMLEWQLCAADVSFLLQVYSTHRCIPARVRLSVSPCTCCATVRAELHALFDSRRRHATLSMRTALLLVLLASIATRQATACIGKAVRRQASEIDLPDRANAA